MSKHGTNPVKKASIEQVLELQHISGRIFKNISWESAQHVLKNKSEREEFSTEIKSICKKWDTKVLGQNVQTHVPLITKPKMLFPGNEYLELISGGEELEIDACKGGFILKPGDDVFAYVDPDFNNFHANGPTKPSSSIKVGVYQLIKNATFKDFLGSVTSKTELLEINLEQMKIFALKYKEWLRTDGCPTFFLFKSSDKFFVTSVYFYDDGRLRIKVSRLGLGHEWYAQSRHRVVIPQLDI